jgi:hypothetical protein
VLAGGDDSEMWMKRPVVQNFHAGSASDQSRHLPEGTMHEPNSFLTRAKECEAMAEFVREPDSKAVWTRMAERWHRCAERETHRPLAARTEAL